MRYKIGDQVLAKYGTLPLSAPSSISTKPARKSSCASVLVSRIGTAKTTSRHSTAAKNKSYGSPFLRWAVVFRLICLRLRW